MWIHVTDPYYKMSSFDSSKNKETKISRHTPIKKCISKFRAFTEIREIKLMILF